ncbi:MAG: RNA-binding transcriptional accessory protein [Pirellula sp.]|nr:RNA-binding transcriptional accessory protein [Pirellula sp.]
MSRHSIIDFDLADAVHSIAKHLNVNDKQVEAAIQLLEAGNTIPFIARYRKELTRGLDEIQLRTIEDAIEKARDLFSRKTTILKTIDEQGLLTEPLRQQIVECQDMQMLEAIYLPFKPKRRTCATIARERGLQPLADILLKQTTLGRSKRDVLKPFVKPDAEVPDEDAALQGALDIVAEQWSDDAETRIWLTEQTMMHGRIVSNVKRGKKEEASKFEMYVDHQESVARLPSHRFLAMKRGEAEGILRVGVELDKVRIVSQIQSHFVKNPQFEFYRDLLSTVEDCFDRLLMPATESTVSQTLKERADAEAITVFGKNLRELLLAPPAGPKVTLGLDPGFRTGCKLAVVDGTGKYLAHTTIFPTPPTNDLQSASKTILDLITKHKIELIAIGNGTASREAEEFITDLIRNHSLQITKAVVSESGASIYSASELAAQEYPNLDVTVRGAISIAHRLQDPLAELVKADPKSIGVGQYQHDVNQNQLRKCLEREVQSCVNSVGVDLNLASSSLLSYVSGIGPKLAENIVSYRDANGRFHNRQQLTEVPKLGAKAFEQAAGFLRIRNGNQPLDNSAVHPECYRLVERMAKKLNVQAESLVGNGGLSQKLKPEEFVDERFGLPTIVDIVHELSKPGRDPRSEFRVVRFSDEVKKIEDLKIGMILEGVITNVTHFGAFVDLGVHHDALIHISQLSNTFIKDPNEVVAVGNVVKVKVLEIDLPRKRIAVTKKLDMPGKA